MSNTINAIFIVPTTYDSLKEKGVLNILNDREESGELTKIFAIHPFSKTNNIVKFSKIQSIYEFKYKSYKNFFIKIFFFLKHLFIIVFKIKKIVSKYNIDFVRSQDPYATGIIGFFLSILLKCKFFVSIHADYDKRFELDKSMNAFTIMNSRKVAKITEKIILNLSDNILPIRESLKNKLIKEGYKSSKITVFPHIVDLSNYKKKPKLNFFKKYKIPKNIKIISFVGRFSKENYIYDYLEIIRNLKDEKKIMFVMAGNGKEMSNIDMIIKNDSLLKKRVRLIGFINQDEVRILRQHSYINLALMGGFSLIESCASGKPVIAYDVEWHSEIISHRKTGLLIKEGDTLEVSNEVHKLLYNQNFAKFLGENSKTVTFEKYNQSNNKMVRTNIYNKLIRGQS